MCYVQLRFKVKTRAFAATLLLWLADTREVKAGYYSYPAGTGQVIVTTSFTEAGHGFDTSSKFIPTERFRKLAFNAYIEVGITDALTAVVKPSVSRASIASPGDAVAADSSGSQLGARYHVATIGAIDFAMEATAVLPDIGLPGGSGLTDGEQGGGEVRALVGRSFALGRWPAFVDAELAYRGHLGAAPDEVRAELTLGVRPRPSWLVLAQCFNIISVGVGRSPFTAFRQHKLQLSVVYAVSMKWSAQMGVIATPAGANAPSEMGAILAVWRRF